MAIFPHTLNTHIFHKLQHTPKMVNTRAKTKRIQNTLQLRISNSKDSMADHQPIMSAALVASNDNLITQILRRLPVTSVLRFKSVSKHWNSLMTHPSFTLLYDRLSVVTPGLFVRNVYIPFDDKNPSTPPFRSLDFWLDLSGIRIVQSCNGLLLCCSDRGHVRARKYYVFNPTTKQFAIVPSVPGGMDVRKTIRFMGLAFHQTDCPHYRVVCIIHRDEDLFQIQIYSSETGKWKISDQTFSVPYYNSFTVGVYWNQAIYWAPSCINPSYFKLDVEQVQKLALPVQVTSSFGGYQEGAIPHYFGESGGHLHLVERHDDENRLHLNVYEMMSDDSGWFLKYQVELDELPVAYPEMIHSYRHPSSPYYYEFQVLDVVRGEEEEDDTFMVVGIPGKMIRFNIMDKSFKQIFDLTNILYGRIGHSEVHRYIQTLSSFYHK